MSTRIEAIEVNRDEHGHWTHPEYEKFCDGRESIDFSEFEGWLHVHGLQQYFEYAPGYIGDDSIDGYDISKWDPVTPGGEGWFIGSIQDSDDGAFCIWLRNKDGAL